MKELGVDNTFVVDDDILLISIEFIIYPYVADVLLKYNKSLTLYIYAGLLCRLSFTLNIVVNIPEV